MVSAWQMYYRPLRYFDWVSLSALDVSRVLQAKADITAWVARLRADLPQDRPRYAADLHHSIYAWDCWYVDFADVAQRLAADPAITDPTLKSAVDHSRRRPPRARWWRLASGSYASEFKGITHLVGHRQRLAQRRTRPTDRQIAFARETGWYAFLKAYNAGHLPGPSQAPNPSVRRAAYGLTDIAFADADHGWAIGYDNVTSEAGHPAHDRRRRPLDDQEPGLRGTSTCQLAVVPRCPACVGRRQRGRLGERHRQDGERRRQLELAGQRHRAVPRGRRLPRRRRMAGWSAAVAPCCTPPTAAAPGRGARGVSNTDLWSVDFADAAHGWVGRRQRRHVRPASSDTRATAARPGPRRRPSPAR